MLAYETNQTSTELTFFCAGSVTPAIILLSSFRMVLAAIPVVADLKSCVWSQLVSVVGNVRGGNVEQRS